ncbi:glycoside hydrolase family 92 protein [Seonamhaeicola sediminis]|uniref:Glycoside hydrolase family 92 protein n=1 Tax=Seonamhaeicola sediminis TaxID=2528206 RepID=A0A562YIZ3_9FLAO|nr:MULTISPECIES: glycoside hydrolase domain-containing protein [Seonamhaeicola]TWO34659.1 glycoside hydrolase family 92 protein [Seonamhaeicola sediminis]
MPPYLYNYLGPPWKTQKIIRELLAENFTSGLGGLPGNEYSGQLSSWYVFGAMDLYPVSPIPDLPDL